MVEHRAIKNPLRVVFSCSSLMRNGKCSWWQGTVEDFPQTFHEMHFLFLSVFEKRKETAQLSSLSLCSCFTLASALPTAHARVKISEWKRKLLRKLVRLLFPLCYQDQKYDMCVAYLYYDTVEILLLFQCRKEWRSGVWFEHVCYAFIFMLENNFVVFEVYLGFNLWWKVS